MIASILTTTILSFVLGTAFIVVFIFGINTGLKMNKGEKIEIPNPVKAVENHFEKIAMQEEERKNNIMLENINNYSGDGFGQKDID